MSPLDMACCLAPGHAPRGRSRAGRQLHSVEDLRVARAAAEVAGQRLSDLVLARARASRQQVDGCDDEARRAEAALNRAGLGEGRLNRVQLAVFAQALHGHELMAVSLGRDDEAGADELAVEEHRARPALALLAGVLGAGKAETLAKNVEQALAGPDVSLVALAVDSQLDSHCRQRSMA